MTKVQVARLLIISNSSLIVMKLAVGLISGSVSIISEAIHSTVDLFASIIAFIAVRISDTPPDEDHPYGHGKYENVSGVIESLLILVGYTDSLSIPSRCHIQDKSQYGLASFLFRSSIFSMDFNKSITFSLPSLVMIA